MTHVSKAYFADAKLAYDTADWCEREAETTEFGDAWRAHLRAEAKRHRERGDNYLKMGRKWIPATREYAA